MKRRFLYWAAVSAAVLVLLPWAVVKTVQSDAGFAVILILLFGIDPAWCLISGFLAGKHLKQLWAVPLVCAGLFVAGTWLCFEMGERVFLLYGAVYFGLGCAAMLVSHILQKRRENNG